MKSPTASVIRRIIAAAAFLVSILHLSIWHSGETVRDLSAVPSFWIMWCAFLYLFLAPFGRRSNEDQKESSKALPKLSASTRLPNIAMQSLKLLNYAALATFLAAAYRLAFWHHGEPFGIIAQTSAFWTCLAACACTIGVQWYISRHE